MTVQVPAISEEFSKQSWETYLIGADNSKVLEEGEYVVLNTSTIVAEDKDGTDASDDILDNTDKAVETASINDVDVTPVTNGMLVTRIQAGVEALSKYKITFKAITSNGNQYETDVLMVIKNS